jgi:hypothetical protein
VQFIGSIAQIAGVPYEWRNEGLMIFAPVPVPKAADEVPASAPAADPVPQLSDDIPATAGESPASAPASDPAPQSSGGTPAAVEEPAAEAAATPLAAEQVAAVADSGSGGVV